MSSCCGGHKRLSSHILIALIFPGAALDGAATSISRIGRRYILSQTLHFEHNNALLKCYKRVHLVFSKQWKLSKWYHLYTIFSWPITAFLTETKFGFTNFAARFEKSQYHVVLNPYDPHERLIHTRKISPRFAQPRPCPSCQRPVARQRCRKHLDTQHPCNRIKGIEIQNIEDSGLWSAMTSL